MKDLNANRLMLTIKWTLLSQWTMHLRMMLGLMFGLLTIAFTCSYKMFGSGDSDRAFGDSQIGGILLFFFFFFIMFSTSSVISYIRTKAQRTAYLMHPASNKEKFIVCWLLSTVVSFLGYIAAVVAADLLHMLFDMIMAQQYYGSLTVEFFTAVWNMFSDILGAFNYVLHKDTGAVLQFVAIAEIAFLMHAIFLFGGIFFRNRAWVCTMGTLFLFLYIISAIGIPRLVYHFVVNVSEWSETSRLALTWCGDAVLLLLVVSVYYAAYRVFCRIQVISNKWINI